jgi:tetratricopeptide (TPR) repeat protein
MTKLMDNKENSWLQQVLVNPVSLIMMGMVACLPLVPLQAQTAAPTVNEVALPGETPYDTYMRIGFAADERGDHLAAAEYFRSALFYVPEDREATIAYWNARRALQASMAPADATPPESDFDRYMRLGYDLTHQRDYQSALINFNRALEERPGDYYATQAARNVSTYIAAQKGEPLAEADVVALNVSDGHVYGEAAYDRYMRLGYAATQEGQHAQAADFFLSAWYERPNDRLATIAFWNAKHNLNLQAGNAAPETETYERYMRLGYDATERHHYQDALAYFEGALQLRPDDEYASQAIRNVSTYLLQGQ